MDLDIGSRFNSYEELIDYLNRFCEATHTKYWKRDARTIGASRTSGVLRHINPDLVYYELKFTCIYGGIEFKSRAQNRRRISPSLKTNGCPSYLRFKVSEDGEALQLVAMNFKHNHELIIPEKKSHLQVTKRKVITGEDMKLQSKRLKALTSLSNVEVEQEQEDSSNELLELLEDCKSETKEEVKREIVTPETFTFRGLVAPVLTHFVNNEKRSVNLDIIPAYARYLKENGIEGVLVNGITGEGMSMTIEERKCVTEAWVDAVAETGHHLMVQIGGAPLPCVLELARHSDSIGVNSIITLPDLFFKPQVVDELIHYLKLISDVAPNTPLLYHHIPKDTYVNVDMAELLNKIGDKVSTFVGILYSSSLLDDGYAALKADEGKYAVFLGTDKLMVGAFTLGFDSAILHTLNIWPNFGVNILHLVQENKIEEVRKIQDQLNTVIDTMRKYGNYISVMKAAMNLFTSINVGVPREPLSPLSAQQEKGLEAELRKLKL